jgi:GMP synthase-like glutamine amidotransferase
MSRAIILQHAEHAGPGRIVPVFRDFGIPTEIRHLYKGDEVPTDLEEIRVLVVLHGPMRVADVSGGNYPFLQTEMQVLQRMVAADRRVLGINFGAQMLAAAAGAKVHLNVKPPPPLPHGQTAPPDPKGSPAGSPPPPTPSPTPLPEFGWAPVTFPFPGGTEPMVFGMTDGAQMFHWHEDAFDLPRLPAPANPPPPPAPPPPTGNALLSSSKLCKNQAFRFKNRLFGFQYHLEMTEIEIEAYCQIERETLIRVLGADGPAKVREDTKKNYPRYARLGEKLLKNYVQFLKAY